jgi:alkylhydroperoxidase family enzyme
MAATTAERPPAAREPRIAPGDTAKIGRVNALIAAVIGRTMGTTAPPRIFTTLPLHRSLYRRWLRFAGGLMPGGKLPRVDSELVILRVAHNCGSDYEWGHHERMGQAAGLTEAQVRAAAGEAPGDGTNGAPFDERQRLLLRAADELHEHRDISDELWGSLAAELSETELIELCMLVGHYEMLAMTLNALRVQPDEFRPGGPTVVARLLGRLRS